MSVEATCVDTGGHALEYILQTDAPLLTLETGQPDALVEQFRHYVRHTGQTVYVWRRGDGLCSLRETGVHVPGCEHLGDTLRYVLKSRHFGVYLISGLVPPLVPADLSLLQRVARARPGFVRRVVLLADGPELAACLGTMAVAFRHEQVGRERLRLRGGLWVT